MKLERLKEWREARGLTQKELSREAHVAEKTVARIELGDSVRPNTARKVADALGVSVADLLERPPVPLSEPSATGQPRPGSTAEGHQHIYRTWEDIEASLSPDQVVEIAKGMEDGRISVREDQARRVQELLQEASSEQNQ